MKHSLWTKGFCLLAAFITVAILLAGCSAGGDPENVLRLNSSSPDGMIVEWSDQDLDGSFSMLGAVLVTLSDGSILVEGEGAELSDNTLTIKEAGTYIIAGELKNGRILVDAGEDDQVRLILNGIDLTSADNAPLYVRQAGSVYLTLAEGTVNTLTDADDYRLGGQDDKPEGALHSNSALTINGSGALVIHARYRHGLVSREDLRIVNATVKVNAAEVGIKGGDLVAVRNAGIAVKAGSAGILAKSERDPGRGLVYIESGNIDIYAYTGGIEAAANLVVLDGELIIESGV